MKLTNIIQHVLPMNTWFKQKEKPVTQCQYVEVDTKFNHLAEQMAALVEQYDVLACQTTDSNTQVLLKDFAQRLINTLVINGCTPIADESTYDPLRHITLSAQPAAKGMEIKSFVRIGVQLNNKILIPAIVEI